MADDMSETRYHKRVKDNPWAEWVSKDVTDEVAALRADLEQTTDERNALLHARTALRAELAGWQTTAQQYEEIVRTTEAELGRVTTERDDAYALIRHYADTDPEVALAERMRPVVEAAGNAVDADRQMYHGAHEHAEANMEATFTALQDAVDAYRTTSEQDAHLSSGECPKPATQSEAVTPTCDECERDGGNHWSHCSHYPGNARAVRFAESRVLAEVRRIIEARPGVRTEAGRTITGAINRRNLLAKLDELREVIVNG